MKVSRIRIIIALMSTALLGIILVQVYWIQSTIAQKERIFTYQVADALAKVSENLETHWIATMLNEQTDLFLNDSLFELGVRSGISAEELLSDSVLAEAMGSDRMRTAGGTESMGTPYDYQGPRGMPNRPTMVLEPVEMGIGFGSESSNEELIPAILKEIDKQFRLNADKLDEVMRQMMIEMVMRGVQPEQKIDTAYLAKTLGLELRNKGVETKFEYGVLLNGNKLITPVSKEMQANLLRTPHLASLFPNNIFFGKDLLMVQFPDQRNYLLSSIWVLMLGSLLFTAVIIFVFSYSIHIILRQKKLSEIKNDFINNMTHEFKTPIATISLAVDAINNPMVLEHQDRIKHYTGIIRDENKRMHSQVEKVLQAALLDKKELTIKRELVDMHEVIQHAVDNISLMVQEKGGQIQSQLQAGKHQYMGDRVHLVNVIYNLLDNANKYSPAAPEIRISTYNRNGHMVIAVQDRGIGMTTEHQKMIFEKFYRVPTGNVHDIKGFGLGLTYVKTVIEAHGGSIEVKSQPDKGSTFTIQLPIN